MSLTPLHEYFSTSPLNPSFVLSTGPFSSIPGSRFSLQLSFVRLLSATLESLAHQPTIHRPPSVPEFHIASSPSAGLAAAPRGGILRFWAPPWGLESVSTRGRHPKDLRCETTSSLAFLWLSARCRTGDAPRGELLLISASPRLMTTLSPDWAPTVAPPLRSLLRDLISGLLSRNNGAGIPSFKNVVRKEDERWLMTINCDLASERR